MNQINTSLRVVDPDLGRIAQSESMAPAGAPKETGFLEAMQKSMESVNEDQLQADHSIKELVAGKSKNIHETMLQIQKAELSLKTMMQVRNKILEAYKEIIRMQV